MERDALAGGTLVPRFDVADARVPTTGYRARRSLPFAVAAVAVASAAVGLRLIGQTTAYELFVDEIQYVDLGNSFAEGRGPELFGEPFFLHPPLFFALLGGIIDQPVTQVTVDLVLELRWVNSIFAAFNVLLIVAVARQVTGRDPALIAGALYTLDPFAIKFDSRVVLETSMMTAVLAGVLAALLAVQANGTRRTWWLIGAGVAFGIALTTKQTSALVTTVPLGLMLITSWGLRRREAACVLGVQAGVYGAYLGWVLATERIGDWWEQTFVGAARAIGTIQQTGFNAPGAPGLLDRVLANLSLFGPTYLLIAVGSAHVAHLLATTRRSLRAGTHPTGRQDSATASSTLLTCWFLGILASIAYTVGFGTLEEQTFYLLAVPSMVAVAMAVSRFAVLPRLVYLAGGMAVAAILFGSSAVWYRVHSTTDDTYHAFTTWAATNLPVGTQLGLTEGMAQFVLPGYGAHAFTSVDDIRTTGARYVLVSTQLTQLGFASITPAVIDTLDARYAVVFHVTGRTSGDLQLYDLNAPLDGSAPVVPGAQGVAP
ncbi:MAG: ArnT family glycosyltransferase [Pseudonocardia sp.]